MENIHQNKVAPEVYKAINNIIGEFSQTGIEKTKENIQQRWKFRGIDDVYNALCPFLYKHKLIVLMNVVEYKQEPDRTSKTGAITISTLMKVKYTMISCIDGSECSEEFVSMGMDTGDKAYGKAASYNYKDWAIKTFCIPVESDTDDDGDKHTFELRLPNVQPPKNGTKSPTLGDQNDLDTRYKPSAITKRESLSVKEEAKKIGMSEMVLRILIKDMLGVESTLLIPSDKLDELMKRIKTWTPEKQAAVNKVAEEFGGEVVSEYIGG